MPKVAPFEELLICNNTTNQSIHKNTPLKGLLNVNIFLWCVNMTKLKNDLFTSKSALFKRLTKKYALLPTRTDKLRDQISLIFQA